MSEYTLVVVDMQEVFEAANYSDVRAGCRKAIRKAIEDNAPIIFLEYKGYAGTIPYFKKIIRDAKYKKVSVVKKISDDGSNETYDTLKEKKYTMTKLKVCGVNTNCCVYSTVYGLVHNYRLRRKIEIIENACGSEYGHEEGINDLQRLKVKIIK